MQLKKYPDLIIFKIIRLEIHLLQTSLEKHCDIYPRTKHGTISPFSILLSHDEHTPWWIGPSPSERGDYQASTLPFSLLSSSTLFKCKNKQETSGSNMFS